MNRKHFTWVFVALIALACGAASAGILPPDIFPPDLLSMAGAAGAMPFVVGEVDMKEVKEIIEKQGKAFEEFKKTNDELLKAKAEGKAVGDLEAKLAKMEKDILSGEELNKKYTALEQEAKAAKLKAEETEKALNELEAKLNRRDLEGGGKKSRDVMLVEWNTWARDAVKAVVNGEINMTPEGLKSLRDMNSLVQKSLSITNDTTGGYLAPSEFVFDIIKTVTEISPARSLARVRSTAAKSIQLPKRTGQFAAVWVAEQGTRSETTGLTYGMLEIPTHEMYALVDISSQNLEDSAFNLAAEIQSESTEQFALAEGTAFVTGSGVGRPEGFVTNSSVATTNSGAAANIKADGMLTMKHTLKSAYARNATWAMNRTTLGAVRKLKDGAGNYLWVPGIASGRPNSIDGDPYVEVPDMASESASAKPIAYGDFLRGYTLVDRIAMEMLRDPYTQATSGNIRFIFRRRLGGMVVLPEAIKILVCAA